MRNQIEYHYGICISRDDVQPVASVKGVDHYLLHFNANDIKHYLEANDDVQRKFTQLITDGVSLAGKSNQSGLKELGNSGVSMTLNYHGKDIVLPVAFELKINRSAARVGVVEVAPKNPQDPTLLIAALYMKDGLHGGKAKKYTKQAYSLSRHGLFRAGALAEDVKRNRGEYSAVPHRPKR